MARRTQARTSSSRAAPRGQGSSRATLERGDRFVGELAPFSISARGMTGLVIDGHHFVAWMPPDPAATGHGVTKWWDLPGRLVVYEYVGPDAQHSVPQIKLRAVVDGAEAKSYARWESAQDDLFGRDRSSNPTLPPFEPAEVQEIRDEIERAVGKVAEKHGLRLQYDDVAASEKAIPIRFKLTRRAPEQRDLFGNPKRTGTAGPRGERLRAVRSVDLAPEMIVVRVPYLMQGERRVPIERYASPPPQRMHVESWDPGRDRARLVDMDTRKVWTHPPSAYPSVLLVEADTIHDAAVRVANPTAGADLFDQLHEGSRVLVKTKSYGPRVVTVTEVPERGASNATVYVTSGKTMRKSLRGGIIQRWDTDPNELLYQPTYTQQIERVQTLELVGMAHNPTDRLAQRLATGHTR